MPQINCINLCEFVMQQNKTIIPWDDIIHNAMELANYDQCERIYVGSYFCENYFLHLQDQCLKALVQMCYDNNISLTLVIPTFSQKNLFKGKEKIEKMSHYFGKQIDEITVNDYGMLQYICTSYSVSLNIGRLLVKDYRDLRYPEYFNQAYKPKVFTNQFCELIKQYPIQTVEFDPTHRVLEFEGVPENVEVAIHYPYCYMTTSHICEYGSIHKSVEKKFRPNDTCAMECMNNRNHYEFHDNHNWTRLGRTVYFNNNEVQIKGINEMRIIYFPMDLEVME